MLRGHGLPRTPLEDGYRPGVREPPRGHRVWRSPVRGPPAALNLGQVSNGVLDRYPLVRLGRPSEGSAAPQRHQDEPLAKLGDAVSPGVDHTLLDGVAEVLQ